MGILKRKNFAFLSGSIIINTCFPSLWIEYFLGIVGIVLVIGKGSVSEMTISFVSGLV